MIHTLPPLDCIWNKTIDTNHSMYIFSEMKGDVGMSSHEKERKQEDATQRQKVIQPHPYIFVFVYELL